ncbi:hypothetical protein YQE_04651, partial [Dendroctonus ponderosae]
MQSFLVSLFVRAAQKLNLSSSPHRRKRHNSDEADPGGFCGALQKCPPPVPPALLRRIGVKEVTGVGKSCPKTESLIIAPSKKTSQFRRGGSWRILWRFAEMSSTSAASASPENRRQRGDGRGK